MKRTIIIILSIIIALSGFFISQVDYKVEYTSLSIFFMLLLSAPTYYYFIKKTNTNKAIKTIIILSLFSMIIESIGIITGTPYGYFTYTERLGAKIGVIPWTVSFGWVPLVIASWTLSENIIKTKKYEQIKKIILGTLILVAFDLVLDPGAVALRFWEWQVQGIYYGIPFTNYIGWIISGSIGMTIITKLMQGDRAHSTFLITAHLGNIFWTMVAIVNFMIIPSIIGIIITIYLSQKILRANNKQNNKTRKK
ncbi:MAG: carotenoid biosynthesis protein [Candidatus Woesearchaeota archaeon]